MRPDLAAGRKELLPRVHVISDVAFMLSMLTWLELATNSVQLSRHDLKEYPL